MSSSAPLIAGPAAGAVVNSRGTKVPPPDRIEELKAIAVQRGAQDIIALFNTNDQLRKTIQQKEEELQKSLKDMDGCAHVFSKTCTQLEQGIAQRNTKIENLDTNIKEKARQIAQLQTNEQKLKEERAKKKEAETKMLELQKENEEKDKQIQVLEEELKQVRSDLQQRESTVKANKKKILSLEKELEDTEKDVEYFEGMSVELVEEDSEMTIARLQTLWRPAIELVDSFFNQDLSQTILEDHYAWSDLNRTKSTVPLPRSNSSAAKSMRVALILAHLADLVHKKIFQPTYLLPEGSGIRSLLLKQAQVYSDREAHIRGVFLAMAEEGGKHESFANRRIADTVQAVMDIVQVLLTTENHKQFHARLEKVVGDIQEIWKVTLHLRRKVDSVLEPISRGGTEWEPYRLNKTLPSNPDQDRSQAAGRRADNILLRIFPAMYLVDETRARQIIPGVALMESQAEEAEKEVQDVERTSQTSPSAPSRPSRNHQSRRRPSVQQPLERQVSSGGTTINHFLSQ